MFEPATNADYHIKEHLTDEQIIGLSDKIKTQFIKKAAIGLE
jgi:hypothetical protein